MLIIIIPILTTSLIHFSLGRLGECTRGKMKGEILTLLIKFHYSLENAYVRLILVCCRRPLCSGAEQSEG